MGKGLMFPIPALRQRTPKIPRLEAQLTQRQQTATFLAQSSTKSMVEDLSILEGCSKEEVPIFPMVGSYSCFRKEENVVCYYLQ